MGFMHLRNNLPLQDAILASGNLYSESGPIFLAVADGHGDISHFRSYTGANIATSVAVEILGKFAQEVRNSDQSAFKNLLSTANITEAVLTNIVGKWKKEVLSHLESNPFTSDELTIIKDHDSRDYAVNPTIAYGTTLIGCGVVASIALFVQIGDGDVIIMDQSGRIFNPIPIDPSLVSNRTTSLCQRDPIPSFRYSVVDLESTAVDIIMIATDGFGNSQTDRDWYGGVMKDIASFSRKHGTFWIRENLPNWARRCASSEGSGDDTTIGLIISEDFLNRNEPGDTN